MYIWARESVFPNIYHCHNGRLGFVSILEFSTLAPPDLCTAPSFPPGLNRTVPSPSAAMAPSPSTVTAPSPSAVTAPSPLAVMATSPPGLSGPNSGTDDDSCSDHDVDSDEEKVENALMRIAREQFVRANHDPVSC